MISKETAEHYVWGGLCDGWHLVRRAELSVIQERVPPGAAEVRHSHARARQFFFVLSGVATLEIGGAREVLRPGEGAEVPPGAPHQLFNESGADVEFIVVSQPASHGDRVELEANPRAQQPAGSAAPRPDAGEVLNTRRLDGAHPAGEETR